MTGADVSVKEGSLDALLRHFHDPTVGMVGGHPIPVNDEDALVGYTVHLLWRLHDQLSRSAAKLGEIVAFRNVVPSIPSDSAVDEISIQALITQLGYRLVYEPRAIVYNRGPTTVRDFLRQRRRIYAGHLNVQQQQGYSASTMSAARVLGALMRLGPFTSPRVAWWTLGAMGLEATARVLGRYDHLRRRQHHIWQMVETTKPHIAEAALTQEQQSILVFRIVDFHEHTLDLGAHAGQMLMEQVKQRLGHTLGADAVVSARAGTVIGLLQTSREEAERRAQQLVHEIEATPARLNGHGAVPVKLSCAIIALSQAGEAQALSVNEPSAVSHQPLAISQQPLAIS
jgi:GGDEF domain-containing protein